MAFAVLLFLVTALSADQDFSAHVDQQARMAGGLSCHARDGYDLSGDAAYVWGLGFHVSSAAECCRACAAHMRLCSQPKPRGKAIRP